MTQEEWQVTGGGMCPRCGNGGIFNYPESYGPKYGPEKFYCEDCDPGHQKPLKPEEVKRMTGRGEGPIRPHARGKG